MAHAAAKAVAASNRLAASETARSAHVVVELGTRGAAFDRLPRACESVCDVAGNTGRVQRRAGIQHDDFARRARLVAQRFEQALPGFGRVFDAQIACRRHRDAEVFRMDFVFAYHAVA